MSQLVVRQRYAVILKNLVDYLRTTVPNYLESVSVDCFFRRFRAEDMTKVAIQTEISL